MFITVIQKKTAELCIARFQRSRGELIFLKGARHRLEADESIADILAPWQSECQHDRIVLALPDDLLTMRELDLPFTDRRKGREIVPLELKGELAAEAEQQAFDVLPLAGGKTVAIWCASQVLAEEIRYFAAQGFDPEVVTFAMFGWQQLLPADCPPVAAISDGAAVAVCRDGRPFYFRVLPGSGQDQLAATVAVLELGREIRVEAIYTVGGGEVDTALATTPLPLNSAITAAFAGDARSAADLAVLYALAQELAAADPVNLRRGPLAYTGARDRLRQKLRLTWVLATVLLLLVFVEAATRLFLVQRDLASLNASIGTIYREIFPARPRAVDEVAEIKAEIRKLGAADGEGVLALLKKLAEAKGDEPHEIYEFDLDGGQVSGRGYDRSAQGVNEFKARVAPLFSTFEVSEIKSRPDGTVSFAFRGALKGGGK